MIIEEERSVDPKKIHGLDAELCRKFRGIESINQVDAILTSKQLLVVGANAISKDGDELHNL